MARGRRRRADDPRSKINFQEQRAQSRRDIENTRRTLGLVHTPEPLLPLTGGLRGLARIGQGLTEAADRARQAFDQVLAAQMNDMARQAQATGTLIARMNGRTERMAQMVDQLRAAGMNTGVVQGGYGNAVDRAAGRRGGLREAVARLRDEAEQQGRFAGPVRAAAGTHDGGGAVDVGPRARGPWAYDWQRRIPQMTVHRQWPMDYIEIRVHVDGMGSVVRIATEQLERWPEVVIPRTLHRMAHELNVDLGDLVRAAMGCGLPIDPHWAREYAGPPDAPGWREMGYIGDGGIRGYRADPGIVDEMQHWAAMFGHGGKSPTKEAETNAAALLASMLTDEQRATWGTEGRGQHRWFEVTSRTSGDRYRVYRQPAFNVHALDGQGRVTVKLCATPKKTDDQGRSLPLDDLIVGQVLALIHNEAAFLAKANRQTLATEHDAAAYDRYFAVPSGRAPDDSKAPQII